MQLSRASIAPGRRSSSSSSAENASSSGRKYSRSWMARTVTWTSARAASNWSRARPSAESRKPSVRAILVRSVAATGIDVHLGAVPQLQSMLQASQEAVGLGQLPGVVVIDVARRPELGQDGERRRGSEIGIESAVHELEQLHGELDVADATAAPLHLAVGRARGGPARSRPGP